MEDLLGRKPTTAKALKEIFASNNDISVIIQRADCLKCPLFIY